MKDLEEEKQGAINEERKDVEDNTRSIGIAEAPEERKTTETEQNVVRTSSIK